MQQIIFQFIAWQYIPSFLTKHLLFQLHRNTARYLSYRPPTPGTATFQLHYRLTYSFVVLAYLLFTIIQASRSMPPNFYEILGAHPDVDEDGLKTAFRHFAKRFHPDRIGPDGAALFMTVRDSFEALRNPVVRFAYDRYGPDVISWKNMSTSKEFLRSIVLQSIGYYIFTGAMLLFHTRSSTGPINFWRYILFCALLISELYLLFYPSATSSFRESPIFIIILRLFSPRRVPFQHIKFLHQLYLFLTAALSNIGPIFWPPSKNNEKMLTEALAAAVEIEATKLLQTELRSLSSHPPSPEIVEALTEEMENMIIEAHIKETNPQWQNALSISSESLPSPGSPPAIPSLSRNITATRQEHDGLLSPRPSPSPPPSIRRNSSHARARSVTC